MINKGNLSIKNIYLGGNNITSVYKGTEKIFPSGGGGYSEEYLTFETIEPGTFNFSTNLSGHSLEYSLDNGSTWIVLPADTDTPIIPADSKILWKSELDPLWYGSPIGTFSSTGEFNIEGNIMSLLYGDNFKNKTILTDEQSTIFFCLFENCSNIINAENLILPATTLSEKCYSSMFYGCSSLITAPSLPATTLTKSCYENMFDGCSSLITAPSLPATTLAEDCYWSMFYNCSSLTTAPKLPATTLADRCYQQMFYNCSSLTTAPVLPATTLVEECYSYMFRGCTALNYIKCLATDISANKCTYVWTNRVSSTGTFVKASSMTSWPTGASGIPSGWTVQDA